MKKLLIAVLALALIVPAAVMVVPSTANAAAQWNMYGKAELDAFYYSFDSQYMNNALGVNQSDTDLGMGLSAGAAGIGATVKVSDQVTGAFEFGDNANGYSTAGDAHWRLLYGQYHFASGLIEVGQDYTPAESFISNQKIDGDEDLLAEGAMYEDRLPMIALKMNNGFVLALITPTTTPAFSTQVTGVGNPTVDQVMPKVEASYDYNSDLFWAGAFAGFQTYNAGTASNKEAVTSYIGGLRGTVHFGPAYVGATGYYGQNLGNYGMWLRDETGSEAQINATGTASEDSTGYGVAGVVGMKFNDMISSEAGIGYMHNECDAANGIGKSEGYGTSYYIQFPITLAPGVQVVPEADYFDQGSGLNQGTYYDNGAFAAYGAVFQINF